MKPVFLFITLLFVQTASADSSDSLRTFIYGAHVRLNTILEHRRSGGIRQDDGIWRIETTEQLMVSAGDLQKIFAGNDGTCVAEAMGVFARINQVSSSANSKLALIERVSLNSEPRVSLSFYPGGNGEMTIYLDQTNGSVKEVYSDQNRKRCSAR